MLIGGVITPQLLLSLYLPALVLALGIGIVTPVLPVYAKSFGLDFGGAAMVFVVYQLGTLVITFPTGLLIDKIGRRPIILAGPALTAVSSLLTAVAGSFPQLLLYRFLGGVANEFWMQSRLAMITDLSASNQRARQITWMFGMQRVGMMLGPAVGGGLALINLRVPFVVYGIITALLIIPVFLFTKESAPSRQPEAGLLLLREARLPGRGLHCSSSSLLSRSSVSSRCSSSPWFAAAMMAAPSTSMPSMPMALGPPCWAVSACLRALHPCPFPLSPGTLWTASAANGSSCPASRFLAHRYCLWP